MALVPCPDCGREVSDAAPTCPRCGRPTTTGRAPLTPVGSTRASDATRGPSSGEILGSLIFLAGAAGCLYFFQFFDVSLPGREIVNLELLSDREHGMIASGVAVVVGIGLALATRRKR